MADESCIWHSGTAVGDRCGGPASTDHAVGLRPDGRMAVLPTAGAFPPIRDTGLYAVRGTGKLVADQGHRLVDKGVSCPIKEVPSKSGILDLIIVRTTHGTDMPNWIPDLPIHEPMPEPPVIDGDDGNWKPSSNAGNNSALEQDSTIPKGWKPTLDKPLPVVRCTGTVRNGEREGQRCGRWSIMGHDKCMVHGGHLPNVQKAAASKVEAAKLRILEDSDLAVDTLFELLRPGVADQVRLGAAKDILDRAAIKGGADMTVEVTHSVSLAGEIEKKIEIMRQRELAKLAEAEAAEAELVDEGEILDAEEVPEG